MILYFSFRHVVPATYLLHTTACSSTLYLVPSLSQSRQHGTSLPVYARLSNLPNFPWEDSTKLYTAPPRSFHLCLFCSRPPPVFLSRADGCGGRERARRSPGRVLPPLPGLILLPCPTTGVGAVVNRHLEAGFKPGTNWCERDHSRKHWICSRFILLIHAARAGFGEKGERILFFS